MSYPIFIDPLAREFTSADLAALLRPFGNVVTAQVVHDSLGISLRFGRAEMESEKDAENVCTKLNRTFLGRDVLTVLRSREA